MAFFKIKAITSVHTSDMSLYVYSRVIQLTLETGPRDVCHSERFACDSNGVELGEFGSVKSNDLRGSVCVRTRQVLYAPVVLGKQCLLLDFLGGREFMQAASKASSACITTS